MNANELKALIVERLISLDEVNVYESERFIKDEKTLKACFLQGDRIRGAWCRRVTRRDQIDAAIGNTFTTFRVFLIESFSNANNSEALLDERIDVIIDELIENPQIALGVHVYTNENAGVRLIDQSPHVLVGHLLHLATIEINISDETNL
jgi:hypothetical protein